MEEFEEFMAEMLEEYNYDKDTIIVTTAFAQALASEWCKKQLSIHSVVVPLFCECTIPNLNYGKGESSNCNKCNKPLK